MAKLTKNQKTAVILYGFWREAEGRQRAMHKARQASGECAEDTMLCDCEIAKDWLTFFTAAELNAAELALA